MFVQRIVAGWLLLVLLLTPLAPAALAGVPALPQHCARQPLAANGPSAGMHCHDTTGHSHHSMAGMPSAATLPPPGDQFRSNGCCNNHDCCNSTVRAQWAQFVPARDFFPADLVQILPTANPVSALFSSRFDSNSGRAPPAL
jgi:hypothetical protein